ncbi:non-ribosomal peptide synthetase, partial [Tenacibaculum xiamenense]|uniref:non-ribosomal peptide synthetase n=1 Tax=Tenacibaculum xiamenense TaxID=1261553 RepID=UPI0038B69A74
HGAYGIVVGKCSDKNYSIFGSLFSGRLQGSIGASDSLGLFINTLPVYIELEGDVLSYLTKVKERLDALLPYEQTPLSDIHGWSDISNDLALFSSLLNYRHSQPDSDDVNVAGIEHLGMKLISAYERTNYPFDLSVDDYGVDFELTAQVSSEIGSERLIGYMEEVLTSLLAGVKTKEQVGDLSILPEEENIRLLEEFNSTRVSYPEEKTLVDLFSAQVLETPDFIAVVYSDESLSYSELDKQSNQLAHYLREQGVKPDDLVGLCLRRGLDMIVGILGILKSGGAYVPIDPDYPQDRIDYIVEDTGIELLLTSGEGCFVKEGVSLLNLESDRELLSTYSSGDLERVLRPDHLAYVIYTSGSTGKPKGVMVEHLGVVNLIETQKKEYGIDSGDVVLQFSNYVFDASVEQLFISLCSGSVLQLIDKEVLLNGEEFSKFIEKQGVTHLDITPSMLQTLPKYNGLTSLKRIIVGGEVCSKELILQWIDDVDFYNVYGLTETTVTSTVSDCIKHKENQEVSIGKPIGNTEIYITDSNLNLQPLGVVGELCIGGLGVARGYLNRPELTKESFVPNPFKEGGRIYKTGDLARWLPDGTIEFIGRKDNQVKIRGHRIELGEIENVLSDFSKVVQCCVVAKEDDLGNKYLVGYVVLSEDLDREELNEFLKERLPSYMIPSLWEILESMPVTSNGKLDRNYLENLKDTFKSSQEYVAPRNTIEESLVSIWEDLLGVEQVGIYDNFFELGGHSLKVVKLISLLQEQGLNLKVQDVFLDPRIASISDRVSVLEKSYQVPENGIVGLVDRITPSMVPLLDFDQSSIDKVVSLIPGGVSTIEDIYPLSPLQEGIYFHHLLSDESQGDPYVLSSLFSFESSSKRKRFIEALDFIVQRHDVLRTCILSVGLPTAVQVVLKEVKIPIEHLSFGSTSDILSELRLLSSPGNQWMDVSQGPLLELKTADDLEANTFYVILNQHHLVLDHVGLEKVVSEISMYLSG